MATHTDQSSSALHPINALIGEGITREQLLAATETKRAAERAEKKADESIPPLEAFVEAVQEQDITSLRRLITAAGEQIPEDNHKKLVAAGFENFEPKIMNALNEAGVRWGSVKPHLAQVIKNDDPLALAWLLKNLQATQKYLCIQPYRPRRKGVVPSGERMYDRGQRASFWGADDQRALWSTQDVPVDPGDPDEGIDPDHENPLCIMANALASIGPRCLQYMALHMPALAWGLDHPGKNPAWIDRYIWSTEMRDYSSHDEMRNRDAARDHMGGILAQGGYWLPETNADLDFWTNVPTYRALLENGVVNLYISALEDEEEGLLAVADRFAAFPEGPKWLAKALTNEIQTVGTRYANVVATYFEEDPTDVGTVIPDKIGPVGRPIVDTATTISFRNKTPARSLLDLMTLTGTDQQLAGVLTSPVLAPGVWKRMAEQDGLPFILAVIQRWTARFCKQSLNDEKIRSWRDTNGNNILHWMVRDAARRAERAERAFGPISAGSWEATDQSGTSGGDENCLKLWAKIAPELMVEPNNFGQTPTVFLPREVVAGIDQTILSQGTKQPSPRRRGHRTI